MPPTPRITTRPPVGPPAPWSFPTAEEHDLGGGLRLLTVHLPGQHVLSLRVVVPAPASQESPGLAGVTLMTARCLDEGTAGHDAEELAELFERHGIAWGAGAGERGLHVGLETTGRHLPTALELLAECLVRPTFPAPEVARQVRHRLTDIQHEHADPSSRAALQFLSTYYDAADRASIPLGGTADTVGALTPEDLAARHADLGRHGATVVLAGDLSTLTDPAGLVAAALEPWEGAGQRGAVPGPARRAADAGGITVVARPGLPQTDLYLGRPGPDRRTPYGWGTYQALGHLLGGSPHARVDRVLREERGYTYGVRAGFRPRARGGLCVAGGAVRADASVPALTELLAILDTPGRELTAEEVASSANFLARTAPGRYATADAVADELVSLVGDRLPLDTVTRTLEDLRGLDRDRVAEAWDEVRTGPGWTVVAVGDPDHLVGLEDLGLGPVRVVSPGRPE